MAKEKKVLVNLRMRQGLLDDLREVRKLTGKSVTRTIHEACEELVKQQQPQLRKLGALRARLFGKEKAA